MTTGQHIREAFEKSLGKPLCLDTEPDAWGEVRYIHSHIQSLFNGYRAGYMALLNELEPEMAITDSNFSSHLVETLYRLPEGVAKP